MGSKMKALTEIARVVAALVCGYLVYWKWSEIRTGDEWYYPVLAGITVVIMMIALLQKLNKGEG